ncbi:MAG: hypothetical protein QOF37_2980 [Thermoleophilaceae bacterium]|nr:hypothetical protein [Thermoleophilaceae bacterium]
MATFDQLPAEQRAIIELVVTRGRSYEALADVLQVPASRVRELARDALVELSPVSGGRVDPQWRSQIADYVLGQQSSAESTATRAHLTRSEPGRTWALSLLDSLDTLYANGDRPQIPEAEDAGGKRGDGAGPAVAVADGEGEERAEEEAESARARRRERAARDRKPAAVAAEKRAEREEAGARDTTAATKGAALSPAARAALRRRRIISTVVGLVVLAGIVVGVLALTGVFSSDSKSTTASSTGTSGTSTTASGQAQTQVLGQIALQPLNGAKAQGVAYILKQGSKQVLAVTAKLPPLPATQRKAAYNVWLFNTPKDAYSIGAQFTTAAGDYQGVGALPANWQRFKFVDVSIQPFNRTTAHSGNSVLRGAFANLKQVPQNQQGGTGTTPTP